MGMIRQLFEQEEQGLLQVLGADRSVDSALNAIFACLDRMKQAYVEQESSSALRMEAVRLFSVARIAASLLTGASETKVFLTLPSAAPQTNNALAPYVLRAKTYLPLVLSGLTSVMLFARGNTFMILLALSATAACAWQTFRRGLPGGKTPPAAPIPEAQGEVCVNPQALVNAVDHLCVTMDRTLQMYSDALETPHERPVWTDQQLEAVQMLWEALQIHDSDYALKAVPALLAALEQQLLLILPYSEDIRQFFDPLPGRESGHTIRPALFRGKTLLARGQVTESMQ